MMYGLKCGPFKLTRYLKLDYAWEKKHNVVVKKAEQGDPQRSENAASGMSLVP